MDYIFISKIILIAILYLISQFVYKKNDWYSKQNEKNNDIELFLTAIFFGLPMFLSLIAFGYIVLFEKSLEYLASREYWEQIVLIFGLIVIYFSFKIYIVGNQKLIDEKDLTIENQKNTIRKLEEEIKNFEEY